MKDPLQEVMADLSYSMEAGSELGYKRVGDQIEVEEYSDDGTTAKIIGYLTFRKVGS